MYLCVMIWVASLQQDKASNIAAHFLYCCISNLFYHYRQFLASLYPFLIKTR